MSFGYFAQKGIGDDTKALAPVIVAGIIAVGLVVVLLVVIALTLKMILVLMFAAGGLYFLVRPKAFPGVPAYMQVVVPVALLALAALVYFGG